MAAIGFWIWAFGFAPKGHPDKLEVRAFPEAAEQICSEIFPGGQWLISDTPQIAENPLERAKLARMAEKEMTRMILDLENLASMQYGASVEELTANQVQKLQEDESLVKRWLGDWRIFLDDYDRWAQKLGQNLDEPLTISTVDEGTRVSDQIEVFAEVNKMDSCSIPDFV